MAAAQQAYQNDIPVAQDITPPLILDARASVCRAFYVSARHEQTVKRESNRKYRENRSRK